MTNDNNMGIFFNWLAKPMDQEDIDTWLSANNIIPELTELFRDFCFSFINLLKDTYLGDDYLESKVTKVGMTIEQKQQHFDWCLGKTIDNFKKENIEFNFKEPDSDFFRSFFFDVFYNQPDTKIKDMIDVFFKQIFDRKTKKSKSDIEIFTDIYKVLERSLKFV
jgi:hypothetical protein